MRVDHRGPYILVPEQFLNGPNIIGVFEQKMASYHRFWTLISRSRSSSSHAAVGVESRVEQVEAELERPLP